MRRFFFTLMAVFPLFSILTCHAQSSGKAQAAPGGLLHLKVVQQVQIPSEQTNSFLLPVTCDNEGNAYLHTDVDGVSGIRKFDPSGKRLAIFQANSATDLKVMVAGRYAVGSDGELFQLAFAQEMPRYVLIFGPDGTYKSKIKLDPGFPWMPALLAPFPGGNLLVAGARYDPDRNNHVKWPFTGIFSSSGKLLKEVTLKDDDAIHEMAARGDSRVTSSEVPGSNSAISLGALEAASNGNIYLMRRLSPALIYAISPEGEVERGFSVDPGQPGYVPLVMHVARNRLAILFQQSQGGGQISGNKIIKVVDLDGHEVAAYEDGQPGLGPGFACYLENPERFTFLTTLGDGSVALQIAKPR